MVMQQEPNAPNLVYELHRRFGDITFGEPIVRRQTSLSDAGEAGAFYHPTQPTVKLTGNLYGDSVLHDNTIVVLLGYDCSAV